MADIGTGATLTFGTSSVTLEILSIEISDISREAIDTTHLETANARTFMPTDLYDPGTMEIEVLYDDDNVSSNQIPFSAAAETLTIEWPAVAPATTGGQFVTTGFITNVSISTPLEDRITATISFKFSGAITFNDGA